MFMNLRNFLGRLFRLFKRLFWSLSRSREIDARRATVEDCAAQSHQNAVILEENAALKDQLRNVGLELQQAREQLESQKPKAEHDLEPEEEIDLKSEDLKPEESNELISRYRDRHALILLPDLVDMLPNGERFRIIDSNARDVDRDIRWRPFPPQRLKFIGFEPDKTEAARLNATPRPGGLEWTFVPAGLWGSSGIVPFEHNKAGGGRSFIPQNRAVTDRWKFENSNEVSLAHEMFFPIGREDMQVVSLSDWAQEAKIDTVDFLKLNAQGSEHEILKGTGGLLDSVLGILIEVAFVESYQDRPFFADTDKLLRGRGFTFFDLLAHHYIGRAATPTAAQHLAVIHPGIGQLVSSWGQLIEGHALYLRDPIADNNALILPLHRLIKLAALAEAYGQVEYAFELLEWLKERPDVKNTPAARDIENLIESGNAQYRELLRNDLKHREATDLLSPARGYVTSYLKKD